MQGIIDDRRSEADIRLTWGMVVGTDRISGWGSTIGKSYFAVPVDSPAQARIVVANMKNRSDMIRVRVVGPDYKPRLREGDHLSIRAMDDCDRFYTMGGFSR